MDNWYYFYNCRGIQEKDLKELSSELEQLGYIYHRPSGLGAGPGLEQIILWIHNSQFFSDVSIGILTNYLYDILKSISSRIAHNKFKNNAVPVIEVFLTFKDLTNSRTSAKLKFRVDQETSKKYLSDKLKIQIEFLYSSSDENIICVICSETISKHSEFYLRRIDIEKPICQTCIDVIKN